MISKRNFLKGAGGALVSLTFLESLAEENQKVPMRMVCVGNNYGFAPVLFFPKDQGKNYTPSPLLKPLEVHKKDLSVFRS